MSTILQKSVIATPIGGDESIEFESQLAAARYFGVAPNTILNAIEGGYSIGNYYLQYPDALNPAPLRERKPGGKVPVPVVLRDVKTNEILNYESVSSAARYLGVDTGALRYAVRKNKPTHGYWVEFPNKDKTE